jgi:hypothetical protein
VPTPKPSPKPDDDDTVCHEGHDLKVPDVADRHRHERHGDKKGKCKKDDDEDEHNG